MSKNNSSHLEEKKRALEIELSRIQTDLDRTIDGVKEDVTNNYSPKSLIRKYPLPIVGTAFVLGLLLGRGKKSTNGKKSPKGIGSIAGKELKSALTKKGIHLLVNYLDDNISRLRNNPR